MHLFMYIFTYIFLFWLKSPLKYIYILLKGVKGRLPSRACARTHAQMHKRHTSARVRRCGSHWASPPCFWGRWVLQESLWSSKLGGSWQSVMDREQRLMTHERAFTHELDFCFCVREFVCCFSFLHLLARTACGKSLMNQLLSHRAE